MNNPILVLVPIVVMLPLLVFWARMFSDMMNNAYLPSNAKYYWMILFIVGNVFAAAYYYVIEYKNHY
jgi:hypothetical protein